MKLKPLFLLLFLSIFCFACQEDSTVAEGPYELPQAESPEAVGLSSEGLATIDELVQSHVDSSLIPGVEVMILRQGQIAYDKRFGLASMEEQTPLEPQSIYRMASMTKPITSVAALILYDEGRLKLDDPVSKYIPEFAEPKVLEEIDLETGEYTTVPAEREVTLRDLFTHTSGISYPFIDPRARAIYGPHGIVDGWTLDPITLADKIPVLGTLPLVHQPGEQWTYGMSIDVLGYIVEIISEQPLAEFMQARIFDPLGMDDTGFYQPEEKSARLLPVYGENAEGMLVPAHQSDPVLQRTLSEAPQTRGMSSASIDSLAQAYINFPVNGAQTYYAGGAGLSGTTEDYARFAQMLTNGGELDGVRILQESTVDLMGSNHYKEDRQFGLGVAINPSSPEAMHPEKPGGFGWGGYFKTRYSSDPSEEMTVLIMSQCNPNRYFDKLAGQITMAAYGAIVREKVEEVSSTN